MYKDDKFKIEPLLQIEEDIKELRLINRNIKRIFLVNGDVFVLSANKLQQITDLIIKHIPEVEVITMYASMNNIKSKSDEDLLRIKDMRINDLWMGTETGNAEATILINKGHKIEDSYQQLERLNKVGIRHCNGLMLGVAGRGKGIENAEDSAKLLNATKPSLVWYGTLGIFEGSKLKEIVARGEFIPASEREIIEEEIRVLELLDLDNVPFYGIHPTNTSSVRGILPQDKEMMIAKLKRFLDREDDAFLDSSMRRDTL